MNNKKIGVLLLILSIVLLGLFIFAISILNKDIEAMGCFQNPGCGDVENSLSIVHAAFGIFGFLFALGFYLIFFSQGEKAVIQRLEADTNKKLNEEKFAILIKGLNEFERETLVAVRDQSGITQSTLRLRVKMSKAKLSQTLSELEKKDLIAREQEGKTFKVYYSFEE
ncbi:hypothetical protein COV20_05090 [Candidatus Woesearchaeota archaeon CG10_big_fil_rev_8_21_14_0_10_45_16]|nr:MAG: hypothetical protein COV20_05090 [Candidatus Woesearchaeota archaeon CG10_big_fil_rev_8_21_14_0_10_45_16]